MKRPLQDTSEKLPDRHSGGANTVVLRLLSLLLLALSCSQANANWFDDDWTFRKPVIVQSSQITGSLTNFPALIRFTDNDVRDHARSDGFDIVFTASDGETQLDHEIERYDSATGELIAWVRLPAVSSTTDTDLFVYFGNDTAANQQNSVGVWDSNYRMVQHLQEAGGPGTSLLDSTSNINNGSVVGTVSNHPTYLSNEIINGARQHPGNIVGGGCTNCTTTIVAGEVVHTWTSGSGTFTAPSGVTSVEYLVIGGGGGGGGITDANAGGAGGGGAGGFRAGTLGVAPGNDYSINVGAGGSGAVCGASCTAGANGGNSVFATITAIGGGRGGFIGNNNGAAGGSGGGGRLNNAATGGAGTAGQGNAGGNGPGSNFSGSGGGGANAAGTTNTTGVGGNGGAGLTSAITGVTQTYSGGGAGGGYNATGGTAGAGGGGGSPATRGAGLPGQANTGGGGGGASGSGAGAAFNGGNGGSGIVVVRYSPPRPNLEVPHSSSLAITGPITAEAWAYIESGQPTPDHNPVFWKGTQIGWGANYLFRIAARGATMTWGVTCGTTEGFFEAGAPQFNQWAHYAITFDGTTTRTYINGAQVGSATSCSGQSLNPTTEPLRSGYAIRQFINEETFLRGRTDELRISSVARPANWLLTQYTMISDPVAFIDIGSLQAQPPELEVLRSVDFTARNPGDEVLHTIEVGNPAGGTAENVVLTEELGKFVDFVIDAFGPGQHFEFEDGLAPPSGLSLGDTFYSVDGVNFDPIPGPLGWDEEMTHWRVEMDGTFNKGSEFILRYRSRVAN